MVDFEQVAHLRGPRLSDLPQHVADVLRPTLAPADEFVLAEQPLASYTFVPYALSGLAAAQVSPAGSATRGRSTVTVPIGDDAGGTDSVSRTVEVHGPGDVLGVDLRQVVRRYPAPGTVDAEETCHPHIEFDRPELPWAFSAQTPGDMMRPWVALVVLEEREVTWLPGGTGLHPVVQVRDDHLPDPGGLHRWAHAQTVGDGGGPALGARLSTAYAPVNVSRLLAARVLTEDTDYVACLVPTTDLGARAAQGLGGGTLAPAWTGTGAGLVQLPVYDSWRFRTAPDGDFPSLARRLQAVRAPWQVGRRTLDTSRPGDPLDDLAAGAPGRRQVVRCALYAVEPPPADQVADAASWDAATTRALKDALERAASLAGTGPDDPTTIDDDLPAVGPRLYARGQRGAATLPVTGADGAPDLTDWFAQLNLTPAHRVVAGLGTRVVQQDAEQLMQAAWAQIGEVDRANRQLAQAQLARHLAESLHTRLSLVDPGRLLQLTRPVAPRVRMPGAQLTLLGQEVRSATPVSALASAFRRAVSPQGTLTRQLAPTERLAAARMVAQEGVARDFTREYVRPDGIVGLSEHALAGLDREALAPALGLDEAAALARVTEAAEGLAGSPSLATTLTRPELWNAPDTTFDPGSRLVERLGERLRSSVADRPASDPVASRWLGGLAAGLVTSGVPGTGGLRDLALDVSKAVVKGGVHEPGHVEVGHGGGGRELGRERRRLHDERLSGGAVWVDPRLGGLDARSLDRDGMGQVLRGEAAWRRGTGRLGDRLREGVHDRLEDRLGDRLRHRLPGDLGDRVARPRPGRTDEERLEGLLTPAATQLATYVQAAQRVDIAAVRADLEHVLGDVGALALPTTPERPPLEVTRRELLERLDPARTVVAAVKARLHAEAVLPPDWFDDTLVRPIMAAPRFDRPMYRALDSYRRDWLVPGLDRIEASDFVTVLSSNDEFTEAFLVGLSDEMGRELLWREYPTDQRGTYFHRFWSGERDELFAQIHRFGPTRLGSHVALGGPAQSNRAVVVVRGEVVRRYPDLTVTAMFATAEHDGIPLLPEAPTGMPQAAPALFYAPLPPDVLIAGLDISIDELRTPGWWVVLGEHPQATRFRCTENGTAARFAQGTGTGADVAADRLELPDRIAFEASTFLPPLR